jgi:membrane protein
VSDWVQSHISESLVIAFKVLDIIVSAGVIMLLFAAIFKFLPDAKIQWRDVWYGAILTAVLFVIAKYLLGVYFGKSDPGSAYGAAGSIILIMLWVSYAGFVLLFGAEFTQVYANSHGRKIRPTEVAVSTEGQTDNGAIVNKKTEAQSKERAQNKTRQSYRREQQRKDPRKLSFAQLLLYMVVTKIKKVL